MLTVAILFTIYFAVAISRGKDPVVWGLFGAGIGALTGLTIVNPLAGLSAHNTYSAPALLTLLELIVLGSMSFVLIGNEKPNKTNTHDPRVDDLIEAVLNEDLHRVRELLEAGANPAERRLDGYSAMDYARGRSLHEIFKLLSDYDDTSTK